MLKTDYSFLFNPQNNMNSLYNLNLTEYASIKSGTYGKLLKAYYNEAKGDSDTTKPSIISKSNQFFNLNKDTDIAKIQNETKDFVETSNKLKDKDLWEKTNDEYNVDSITSAVKSFVSDYNNVIKQSKDVSVSTLTKDVNYMTSLTDVMSNALSKVGITIADDKKLILDEKKFKESNMDDVKTLFSGVSSYATQLQDRANLLYKDSIMTVNTYDSNGNLNNNYTNMFNFYY